MIKKFLNILEGIFIEISFIFFVLFIGFLISLLLSGLYAS